jgi:beta-glucosidase/6-phospho-beta-glucosidase/beta-galactosidase
VTAGREPEESSPGRHFEKSHSEPAVQSIRHTESSTRLQNVSKTRAFRAGIDWTRQEPMLDWKGWRERDLERK